MSREERFSKLERKRRGDSVEPEDDAPVEEASAGHRFDKIAPVVAEAPPDPFAPPPEVPIEISEDDRLDVVHAREARMAAAAATRAADMQRHMQAHMEVPVSLLHDDRAPPLPAVRSANPLARLDNRDRAMITAGGLGAIALLAGIVAPYFWGLAPILIAVMLASALADDRVH